MYMAQMSRQVELRDQLATREDLRPALSWASTKDMMGDGDNRDMGMVVSTFTNTHTHITNHVICCFFWVLSLFAFPDSV